ncbi:hypothetical protein Ocin01_07226, partial [Orchesella cincta]
MGLGISAMKSTNVLLLQLDQYAQRQLFLSALPRDDMS